MIKEILQYLNDGGLFSVNSIAKKFNITDEMATDYRDKLIKFNYIKKIVSCSSEMCSKCSCGCSNKTLSNIESWEITEKGLKIIGAN